MASPPHTFEAEGCISRSPQEIVWFLHNDRDVFSIYLAGYNEFRAFPSFVRVQASLRTNFGAHFTGLIQEEKPFR